jgi:hypothetical protein
LYVQLLAGSLTVFDAISLTVVTTVDCIPHFKSNPHLSLRNRLAARCLAFNPTGEVLAVGTPTGSILLLEVSNDYACKV